MKYHPILTSTVVFVLGVARAQGIVYVDQSAAGANDGASWTDAFVDLQDALAVATSGDEIWVAAGSYTPAPPDGPVEATFLVPTGVALYGGFNGTETTRVQRDPSLNITTLSGDYNGDDTIQLVILPNAWHVVTMNAPDAATRLDGFEIISGYAFFGPSTEKTGAGVKLTGGSPTIANCGFTRCFAENGGGIHAFDASITVDHCRFNGNIGSAWLGTGGGIVAQGAGTATITDCQFLDNTAEARGGWSHGGAIYNNLTGPVTIQRCDFIGNSALHRSGGGVDWCRGGAIFAQGSTVINQCVFDGNISNVAGAVQSWTTLPNTTRILNSTFRGNDAVGLFVSGQPRDGAAGAIAGGSEMSIIGCVVYGGSADNYGGVWVDAPTSGSVVNSIFWNNSDSSGNIGTSNVRSTGLVEYCCVQNMLVGQPGEDPPNPADFPGSISDDPMFADPNFGDFHLLAGSPCIDAGDNTAWPPEAMTDLDGNDRLFDDVNTPDTGNGTPPIGDMGAFEFGSGAGPAAIPAMSAWGVTILALLLLTSGTILLDPRRRTHSA